MDVFSWGALVAFAATGKHPYGGTDIASRVARMMYAEPDLDGVPASLRRTVASALRRDPAERPTADQILARLASGNAFTGGVRALPGSLGRYGWRERRRVIALAAGVPTALVLVIGAANGMRPGDGQDPARDRPAASTTVAGSPGVPIGNSGGPASGAPDADGTQPGQAGGIGAGTTESAAEVNGATGAGVEPTVGGPAAGGPAADPATGGGATTGLPSVTPGPATVTTTAAATDPEATKKNGKPKKTKSP
jgi:hypothetical protein